MALTFADFGTLQADLESKNGIEAADSTLPAPVASSFGFNIYDLPVLKKVIDSDGVTRYVSALQQIVEDAADGSFGYGANRQWDLKDDTQTQYQQDFVTQAKSYVGAVVGGATVLKIKVNSITEADQFGLITGYFDDGTQKTALLYGNTGGWNIEIITNA